MYTSKINIESFLTTTIANGVAEKLFPGCSLGYYSPDTQLITASSKTRAATTPEILDYSSKTLFDIASLTKPIIGLIALRLIDTNQISLDSKIAELVQGVGEGWKNITIKHLLTNSLELNLSYKLHEMRTEHIRDAILKSPTMGLGNNFYYHNTTSIILGWFLERFLQMMMIKNY